MPLHLTSSGAKTRSQLADFASFTSLLTVLTGFGAAKDNEAVGCLEQCSCLQSHVIHSSEYRNPNLLRTSRWISSIRVHHCSMALAEMNLILVPPTQTSRHVSPNAVSLDLTASSRTPGQTASDA